MNKQTKSHSHSHSNLNNQSSSPSTPILVILFFGIYLTFVGTSSNSWKIGKDGNGQLGLEKLCAQVNFVEYRVLQFGFKHHRGQLYVLSPLSKQAR